MSSDSPVDMSKLTERELLILLNERVSNVADKLERVSKGHYDLEREVDRMKTRNKTIAVVWGFVGVLITIFINAFKIFK